MEPSTLLNEPSQEMLVLLRQMLTSATREASIAMSRWVGSLVDLTLEETRPVPLAEVSTALGLEAVASVLVVVSIRPPLAGDIILHFDEQNARALAANLIGSFSPSAESWSDLEQSALLETGNILGCGYVNALSRLIDHELVPLAPWLVLDYAESVIEQALALQAEHSDWVIISRTLFRREGNDLNWSVLFLPSPALQGAMNRAIHAGARTVR